MSMERGRKWQVEVNVNVWGRIGYTLIERTKVQWGQKDVSGEKEGF